MTGQLWSLEKGGLGLWFTKGMLFGWWKRWCWQVGQWIDCTSTFCSSSLLDDKGLLELMVGCFMHYGWCMVAMQKGPTCFVPCLMFSLLINFCSYSCTWIGFKETLLMEHGFLPPFYSKMLCLGYIVLKWLYMTSKILWPSSYLCYICHISCLICMPDTSSYIYIYISSDIWSWYPIFKTLS